MYVPMDVEVGREPRGSESYFIHRDSRRPHGQVRSLGFVVVVAFGVSAVATVAAGLHGTVRNSASNVEKEATLLDDLCSNAGDDCLRTKCCNDPSMSCYEKDIGWATCKQECVPGIDQSEYKQFRTPWSCKKLGGMDKTVSDAPTPTTNHAPSPAPAPALVRNCSAEGEHCQESTCCRDPSLTCFEKFKGGWAKCMSTCSPATDGMSCGVLGKTKDVPCSDEGKSCVDSRCCSSPGLRCFSKHDHWAICRTSCTPGVNVSEPRIAQTPWSCAVLTTSTTTLSSSTSMMADKSAAAAVTLTTATAVATTTTVVTTTPAATTKAVAVTTVAMTTITTTMAGTTTEAATTTLVVTTTPAVTTTVAATTTTAATTTGAATTTAAATTTSASSTAAAATTTPPPTTTMAACSPLVGNSDVSVTPYNTQEDYLRVIDIKPIRNLEVDTLSYYCELTSTIGVAVGIFDAGRNLLASSGTAVERTCGAKEWVDMHISPKVSLSTGDIYYIVHLQTYGTWFSARGSGDLSVVSKGMQHFAFYQETAMPATLPEVLGWGDGIAGTLSLVAKLCKGGKERHATEADAEMDATSKDDAHADTKVSQKDCHTAAKGEQCHAEVTWAMNTGIKTHPEWYSGLTTASTFEDFQAELNMMGRANCRSPCWGPSTSASMVASTHAATSRTTTAATSSIPVFTTAVPASNAALPTVGPAASLFCFTLMRPGGIEETLMRSQLNHTAGIFLCDSYAVLSNVTLNLASASSQIVTTEDLGVGSLDWEVGGPHNTALNSKIFETVWRRISADARFRQSEWTVKVDADAVFLPPRLRESVTRYLDLSNSRPVDPVYFNNCQGGLQGPLEVISVGGMEALSAGFERCHAALVQEFVSMYGEATFLKRCLELLGVDHADYFSLLSDPACPRPGHDDDAGSALSCEAGSVAFHPVTSSAKYFDCLRQAERVHVEA